MMSAKALKLIASGIEPIDKLLGGLESGHLYLAHGDASGKSLFGIKFLIEGLKRGEKGALVIRYSYEDAVRRFARLGYDCLADVQEGRLIILEYSDDLLSQINQLPELMPVLRELEWVLNELRPERIIFDPVTQLFTGETGEPAARVQEFTKWASAFDATVLLVASGDGKHKAVEELTPLVRESFRFDVAESGEHATRLFAFEKSPTIADQAIEVDPTRGIFLLERVPAQMDQAPQPAQKILHMAAPGETRHRPQPVISEIAAQTVSSQPYRETRGKQDSVRISSAVTARDNRFTEDNSILELDDIDLGISPTGPVAVRVEPAIMSSARSSVGTAVSAPVRKIAAEQLPPPVRQAVEAEPDALARDTGKQAEAEAPRVVDFNTFLDEMDAAIASMNLPGEAAEVVNTGKDHESLPPQPNPANGSELSWQKIESLSVTQGEATINPKDFHIVIIDEDASWRDRLAKTLDDYRVEPLEDIVTGIARIMTSTPDLVILDIDMSIVDGFKVLMQIRGSVSAPIILVTKSHVRASDRIFSTELGADYYLTKPFSQKELKQKARQLIARYRGITSWIMAPVPKGEAKKVVEPARTELTEIVDIFPERRANFNRALARSKKYQLEPYEQFIAQVEASVKVAAEKGTAFSIVGCRIESGAGNADREAVRFFKAIMPLVRSSDLISTNPHNELVILLPETSAKGARVFIRRLRNDIGEDMRQALSVWMRSYPTMEEEKESFAS